MSLRECLIIQPIHSIGYEVLKAAGITPRLASKPDMDTVAAEVGDAVAAITRNAGFSRKALEAAARLRVIGNHGIGTDPVAVDYATEIGVPVVNNPTANIQGVAEHVIALMLAVARRMPLADQAVRAGDWQFKFKHKQIELAGKTLGIVGFGAIGRLTAATARAAFGMRIITYSPHAPEAEIVAAGATRVDLPTLMRESDVVSLHVKLTDATRNMINREMIALMKPTAILVNSARGAAVDEAALAEALHQGRIFGAGIDVFGKEPAPLDHPLIGAPNAVLAAHIGGSTEESLWRTAEECARQVVDVLEGRRPKNIVNPAAWDRRRQG
ncbi:MAG: hydroxyacid dehydrogenase [Alphaproteobacteria bacterium]|nr:hydroxyacid dehydrogenase [Alphaproteobacteria bacterium]